MRSQVWNIFFGLLYVAVAVYGIHTLAAANRLATWVPAGDFFLLTLAVFRLTRLVTTDSFMQPVREWFGRATTDTFRGTIGALLNCTWCTGMWMALFVLLAYFAWTTAWYGILLLALAAAGSFTQSLANAVTMYAKEREVRIERMRE